MVVLSFLACLFETLFLTLFFVVLGFSASADGARLLLFSALGECFFGVAEVRLLALSVSVSAPRLTF